jgi:two-component sensor histidine kinase
LITGSKGYLTRFQPKALSLPEKAPPVALARVQVNGKDTATYFSQKPIWNYQSTLLFDFAALSFNNATQNQYQYMLEGADKTWNPVTLNHTVTYAQLPAGNYTFLVKGSNSDGVWNPDAVSFSFRIEAPFYLKGWFIILVVLFVAGMVMAFYRYRLSQALQVERLRTRLATDLHDDVGATLSAISMYSDALQKQVDKPQLVNLLEKIGDDSREMVRTMSDLVWAINPDNDGGDKLVQRMENFAIDLCTSKEVMLQFESDPKVPAHTIGIETRRNIFLIFKEAINNVLKYADCTQLRVKIEMEGNHLLLSIADNGRGFDATQTFSGNGLKNMKTRAAEMKGSLSIESKPAMGSIVRLKCPI